VTQHRPTALIADDEPLLRRSLTRMLASAWPELDVVAQARNGREAVQLFEADHPDVCFLDVHMPGLSGVEAARAIGRRAHLVFVTAFDRYAVQAFEQGALDYLVKPVERARLDDTVARLKERLRSAQTLPLTEELLEQLAAQLRRKTGPQPLNWIRASLGQSLRMIPVDGIEYPALRREVHAHRLAGRGRRTGGGARQDAAEGAAGAARRDAVRAGAPLGGGQPARGQPRHARPERDRAGAPQGTRRGAAGEPQLPAPFRQM
jgi:DNA-binding LytR/AlgR family response regulator